MSAIPMCPYCGHKSAGLMIHERGCTGLTAPVRGSGKLQSVEWEGPPAPPAFLPGDVVENVADDGDVGARGVILGQLFDADWWIKYERGYAYSPATSLVLISRQGNPGLAAPRAESPPRKSGAVASPQSASPAAREIPTDHRGVYGDFAKRPMLMLHTIHTLSGRETWCRVCDHRVDGGLRHGRDCSLAVVTGQPRMEWTR